MAAGWTKPQFTPADQLRAKSDATEGTWTVTYVYDDGSGLPDFTYSETFPNASQPTGWGAAKYTAFSTRAKSAKTAFDTVRSTLVSAQTSILTGLNS